MYWLSQKRQYHGVAASVLARMRSTVKAMQLGVSLHFWQHSYGLSRSRVGKSSMIGFLVVFQ